MAESTRENEMSDAERAAQQQSDAAKAEGKRAQAIAREMERASVPEDAGGPPRVKVNRTTGVRSYPLERFLEQADGPALTGVEPHILAGALHGVGDAYLTVDDVRQRVDDWLAREVQ